ncbi:MAG: hypothetical protein GF346_09780 [Candidatus Eisenbacteria bacterium]|nr:hypothetical protein [Candidatus Latescibacterota bacterium]MBD3302723.1 hypothetical protein [Candidatus Eisenbacteria bacterium]
MQLLHRSLILLAVGLLFVPPSAAEILPREEVVTGSDGLRYARTVCANAARPMEDARPPVFAGSRGVNEYLWLDRDHGNAIAENVAISGDGRYGIAGWWLNDRRASLYRVSGGSGEPEWSRPMAHAEFQISVDADQPGSRLTTTARGESLFVFGAQSPDPIYADWFSPPYAGRHCGVSDEGTTFAGTGANPEGIGGELRVYDGSTGALRFIRTLPAQPEGLSVSADGQVVAANASGFVKIWDAITGALRDSISIPGETGVPAVLSADGSSLVTGDYSRNVRLYHWNGSEYVEQWTHPIPGTTSVTALAISGDGTTIVAGTWTNPTGGRVVVYDQANPSPLWVDSSFGDEVASVAVAPDGGKIAAACWGRRDGTVGNVVSVYERSSPLPLWTIGDDAIAGVGSCMSVDLSDDGRFLLAGGKAVHAREFGTGGFVLAIAVTGPTGVPDLFEAPVLTARPNPFRGSLHLGGSDRGFSVWSADGRRIRALVGSLWDGRDGAGRAVPAGIYLIRGADGETAPIRVVRIR